MLVPGVSESAMTGAGWIPYLALLAALGAWWISFRESRRNNNVIVRLERFNAVSTGTASGGWEELRVLIVNRGIPLHNIGMALRFRGRGGAGSMTIRLRPELRDDNDHSMFSRGMRASFVLTSHDEQGISFLKALESVSQQAPTLLLFNNAFHACSFRLYGRFDPLKLWWDNLASRKVILRRVGEGYDGQGVHKLYELPGFDVRSFQLQQFLESIRGEPPVEKPPSAGSPFARSSP